MRVVVYQVRPVQVKVKPGQTDLGNAQSSLTWHQLLQDLLEAATVESRVSTVTMEDGRGGGRRLGCPGSRRCCC